MTQPHIRPTMSFPQHVRLLSIQPLRVGIYPTQGSPWTNQTGDVAVFVFDGGGPSSYERLKQALCEHNSILKDGEGLNNLIHLTRHWEQFSNDNPKGVIVIANIKERTVHEYHLGKLGICPSQSCNRWIALYGMHSIDFRRTNPGTFLIDENQPSADCVVRF